MISQLLFTSASYGMHRGPAPQIDWVSVATLGFTAGGFAYLQKLYGWPELSEEDLIVEIDEDILELELDLSPQAFGSPLDIETLSLLTPETLEFIGIKTLLRRIFFSSNYWLNAPIQRPLLYSLHDGLIDGNEFRSYPPVKRLLNLGFSVAVSEKGYVPLLQSKFFIFPDCAECGDPWVIFRQRTWVPPVLFQGKLGDLLSYNEELSQTLLSTAQSIREAQRSMISLHAYLINPKIHINDKLKVVDIDGELKKSGNVKKYAQTKDRYMRTLGAFTMMLESWIKYSFGYVDILENCYPSVLEAYFMFEYYQFMIQRGNAVSLNQHGIQSITISSADALLFSRIVFRYSIVSLLEEAQIMMLPYANTLLSSMGEDRVEPLHFLPALQAEMENAIVLHPLHSSLLLSSRPSPSSAKKEVKKSPPTKKNCKNNKKKKKQTLCQPTIQEPCIIKIEVEKQEAIVFEECVETEEPAHITLISSDAVGIVKLKKTNPHKLTEDERKRKDRERAEHITDQNRKEREKKVCIAHECSRARLTAEQMDIILANLSTSNQIIFETLFQGQYADANYKITNQDIQTFADHIQMYMNEFFQNSDKSFSKLIWKKLHRAHDSTDKGGLLPAFYLETIRPYFMMYGVKPRGW